MVDESRCVLGALGLLEGLRAFSETKKLPELQRVAAVQSALAQIDQATRILTISLHRWGMAVNPVSRNSLPSRFRDTVDLASRVASIAWQVGKSLPIQDPYPAYRLQALRKWSTEDFSTGDQAALWTDVTDLWHQGGEFDVTFQFLEGDVGLDIHSVVLLRGATREVAQPVDEERWNFHVGRWDRWTEYWISAPTEVKSSEKAGDRYFLKMEVSRPGAGAGADRHSTHGRILFRKSWRGEKL